MCAAPVVDLPQAPEVCVRSVGAMHGRRTSLSQLMHMCSWLWWVGWGQGNRWWMVCMCDNDGGLVACREMPGHFPGARCCTVFQVHRSG